MRYLIAFSVCAAGILAAAGQARDVRPGPTVGTSAIGGQVVSLDQPPAPVRQARVVVTSTNLFVTRSVMSGDDGKFLLTGLPAGRYTISAAKAGWLRSSYGAARPTRPGTAVEVAAGQTTGDIVVGLARGGVITGLVTDSEGRPARGVPMRVQEVRVVGGNRVIGGVISITPGTTGEATDDRGEYRLFGLSPGEYVVSAAPTDSADGQTRLMSGGTIGSVPVYFPGTAVAADAQTVTVKSGEETPAVSFRLQFARTARVAGVVSAPAGIQPGDVQITLAPRSATAPAGSYQAMMTAIRSLTGVLPDWTFSYSGVTPGMYTVTARVAERSPTAKPGPSFLSLNNAPTRLWAMAEIAVDGTDHTSLDLSLQPGMTVSGRVALQHAPATAAPDLTRVRVTLSSANRLAGGLALAVPSATVDAAGQFTVRGVVPGQYHVNASVSGTGGGSWSVASAVSGGRDTLDFPLDVRANEDAAGLVVTLTDVTQRVSGLFQDAAGRPVTAFTMVLFPEDPALRTVSRRIRTARPGQDGRYAIERVPAGDYRLAAVFDITTAEANDPQFLETLVAGSIPLSIRPGERKIQNVKISR